MTTPQQAPETIFNDLLERFVHLLSRNEQLSAFEVRRLERDVATLTKVDAAGALELRGHLAALQSDFVACDENFEKALRLTSDRTSTVVRYLVVLGATAQGDRLKDEFQRHKSLLRNDPQAIQAVTDLLAGAGWLRTSDDFAREGARLGAANLRVLGADALCFDAVAEQEIAAAVSFSHNFLRSRGAQPEAVEAILVPAEDGTPSLFYQFSVEGEPADVANLEWDLFEALAGKGFPLQQDGVVAFGVAAGAVADAH